MNSGINKMSEFAMLIMYCLTYKTKNMAIYLLYWLCTLVFSDVFVENSDLTHRDSTFYIEEQDVLCQAPKTFENHILLEDTITATIYHACAKECNSDPTRPASWNFVIDTNRPGAHKIIAMERTLQAKHNLKWGDIVYIEGTDYDGYYQVQDRMNKRYAGMARIDILVDNKIRYGKWKDVKLYKVECDSTTLAQIQEEEFLASLPIPKKIKS